MAKKASRRGDTEGGLNITSMMDMMTIILVFLLKSYSTDDISAAGDEGLVLPVSSSIKPPKLAVNVVVSQTHITVDGEEVVLVEPYQNEATGRTSFRIPESEIAGAGLVTRLADKLEEKAETAKEIGKRTSSDEFGFKGQILLQVDRDIPYSVVRAVMFTAGQQQYGEFRFVVIKGSE